MREERKIKLNTDIDFIVPIMLLFFMFWQQGAWYRVDCALGVQKACELIAHEKEYSKIKDQ